MKVKEFIERLQDLEQPNYDIVMLDDYDNTYAISDIKFNSEGFYTIEGELE